MQKPKMALALLASLTTLMVLLVLVTTIGPHVESPFIRKVYFYVCGFLGFMSAGWTGALVFALRNARVMDAAEKWKFSRLFTLSLVTASAAIIGVFVALYFEFFEFTFKLVLSMLETGLVSWAGVSLYLAVIMAGLFGTPLLLVRIGLCEPIQRSASRIAKVG